MKPPPPSPPPCSSLHSNFFSSLKQVEKRLKLDHQSQCEALHPPSPRRDAPPLPVETISSSAEESLSSPMYLHFPQTNTSSALQQSSGPPLEFLSNFSQSPSKSESNHPNAIHRVENRDVDDIERLIQLLGLGDSCVGKELEAKSGCNGCEGCESGFYSKIVGFKGPKCGKGVERLDGWINYFLNGDGDGDGKEERLEPLRLAYLLLGKAVFGSNGGDGCLEELEFPSTVEDFLLNDPPA